MEHKVTVTIKAITLTALTLILITACNPQTLPEQPGLTEALQVLAITEEDLTSTPVPLPSSTTTIKPTPTATLPPPPTATDTPTRLPTETETPTATVTPNTVQPGLYSANGCVRQIFGEFAAAQIEFCVISIEVDRNGFMTFIVTWTAYMPPRVTIRKGADESNMYLTDELGNRYDHIATSGSAGSEFNFALSGDTTQGVFIFPRARPDATIFTFHDDDNHDEIPNLVLVNPTIIREVSELAWYPFAVEYLLENWTGSRTPEGGVFLTHNQYPTCQLIEWAPGELVGNYKNTVELGPVTYDLYGWNETDWSVREYLAISGLEGITEEVQPFFHLQVPYENAQDCIFDASEVLSSLFEP